MLVDGLAAKGGDGHAQALSRYHAAVVDNPGGGQLVVHRLHGSVRHFPVRSRLVVGHWRRSAATVKREEAIE